MTTKEQAFKAVKAMAAARGKDMRTTLKREFAAMRDEALVEAGHAAERRIAARERRQALLRAGKVAAVAGAGVAAVLVTRAALQRRKGKTKRA